MCGFAGFLGAPTSRADAVAWLDDMASALYLRGPDGEGHWLREDIAVGLAHRRLAVVGLGPDGQQPMHSASGRWIIAYNGEIYNAGALRNDLIQLGASFRGSSDTEVLLAAIEFWGIDRTLDRLVGMFALALWDEKDQVLHLVRDRFGEKPLYYGWQGKSFLFGSDLAALRRHPAWVGGVDRDALALYARYNYVPAGLSIHPGIRKLGAGRRLTLSRLTGRWHETEHCYWSAATAAAKARSKGYEGNVEDATETLHAMLKAAIAGQMVSEVPLGAFLSGGIDSSLVVSLMQEISSHPVRTFTIGFSDAGYNEAPDAARVARHLGTHHQQWLLEPRDALSLIPRLPEIYSEPFADASQVATALVCQMARQEVTVALSGDGGDEVFGGYNRYVWGGPLWQRSRRVPAIMRSLAATCLTSVSPERWDTGFATILGQRLRQPGEKLHKLAAFLGASTPQAAYGRLVNFWLHGNPVLHNTEMPQLDSSIDAVWESDWRMTEAMMLSDTQTYLPDDILVKVDRAAMGASLETRAPFLDHRLFEFAWSLPVEFRIGDRGGKDLLRRILDGHVPRALIDRPKSGFALPIHDWLRGPLRDWAENLIDESRLRREDLFDPRLIRQTWHEHLSGKRNRQYDLWSILMFQAWLEKWS